MIVLLGRLFSSSGRLRQQALHERGFLLVAQALEKSSAVHLTSELLQELIRLVEKLHLLPTNHGPALLRQLADYILFNPALWCRAPPKVQIELQKFLATEFISSKLIQSSLRRVSTTLIFLHALKYYYWLVDPTDRSNIQVDHGVYPYQTFNPFLSVPRICKKPTKRSRTVKSSSISFTVPQATDATTKI